MMNLPLAGIKVLDLTRIMAGPYASMLLADMGAEVIKLEPPIGDEFRFFGPPFQKGESHLFMALNRNKKGIVIDLKKEKGKEIIYKLVKISDIFMQNFRQGIAEKLGLNYEKLKEINPRLIYCVNTAFGEKGPYKDRAGFDLILQGHGGTMYRTEGEPQLFPVLVADSTSGMLMAFGIMVALYERQKTGRGQMVTSSLFNSILAQQILILFEGEEHPPAGPIAKPHDLIHDPQVLENNMVVELTHPKAGKIKQLNVPIGLSDTPGSIRSPAPTLGQHTKEVLMDLGYSEQEITEMGNQKII